MNFTQHSKMKWLAAIAGLCLCSSSFSYAATSTVTPGPKAQEPVEKAAPKAAFTMPRNPTEGKDPFFPRSIKCYGIVQAPVTPVPTSAPPVMVEIELRLGGISGSPEKRLAIINGRTFEAGEEGEVNSSHGRVRLRCLEIRPEGAIVLINGQRRELRMRSGL